MEFKLLIALLILCVIVLIVLDEICRFSGKGFKSWKPMSDDEFMNELPEGSNREIALKVRAIVAKQTGVPRDSIRPDTQFIDLTN